MNRELLNKELLVNLEKFLREEERRHYTQQLNCLLTENKLELLTNGSLFLKIPFSKFWLLSICSGMYEIDGVKQFRWGGVILAKFE